MLAIYSSRGVCIIEKKDYKWQRFWYPRETPIPLENGYLSLPSQEYAQYFQDERKTLNQLKGIPCLILLGEPGIGKSSEIEKWVTVFREQQQDHVEILQIDLGGQTESTLNEELFTGQTYQIWLCGTHQLYLFLDGLDEGLLTIQTLTQWLSRKLQKLPKERLFLRITCRTADWPSGFEERLKQLWGDECVQIYHLAPLSRRDVAEVADEQFLLEVARREIEPLAAKPFTLKFLLNTYHPQTGFPRTLTDLYYEGCRVLCEEVSDTRRETNNQRNLNADQRLMIAARIAALMIFAYRTTIWAGKDLGNIQMSDLSLREVWGDKEYVHQSAIEVNNVAIQETLNTGLFASRGSERLGWVHKTYAEFLAAFYLTEHNLAPTQIKELLTQDDRGEEQLVPQLHQTIAWLATLRTDVFHEIMKIEPEILVRSDITMAEEHTKKQLVETLFQLDEIRLWQFNQQYYKSYQRLAHRGLSDQLRPYLHKNAINRAAKVLAIKIAEACFLQNLQTELCSLAFDLTQDKLVREQATCALATIGDNTTKTQLKALLNLEREQDPDDELKGYALKGLWPGYLTAEEFFHALTPPKNDHFSGVYNRFIWSEPIEQLKLEDLPIALRWYEKLPPRHQPSNHLLFSLADAIMVRSLQQLNGTEVLEACARTIFARARLFDTMLIDSQQQASQSLPITQGQRLKLLEHVLSFSTNDKSSLIQLLSLKPRLILPQDISWLMEYLLKAETEQQQRDAACILYYAVNRNDSEQMNMVCKACEQNAILANEFASTLNTSEANTAEEIIADENDASDAYPILTLTEEMASFLEQDNDVQKKWTQCWTKAANLTYPSLNGALIDQQALFPGWDIIAKSIQTQLFDLAEQYIRECDPKSQEWIETQQMPLSVWITYKTLQLFIQHEKTECLLVLPTEQWQKLAPVVLVLSRPEGLSIDDELMNITSTKAIDVLTQNTLFLVDSIGKHSTDISVVDKISRYWNTTIEKAFLSKVQETSLNLNGFSCLLRGLLIHHTEEAIAFAHSLLSTDISNEKQCERVILATCALLLYADHLDWSLVRSVMDQNEDYAKKLLQKLAQKTPVPQQLSVDEIADLYIRLVRYYPPIHYPLHQDTDFVGTVDSIAFWRNALIGFLKEQGTAQACAAIERIINEGTDIEQFSLKWILREAQQLTRWQSWDPFAPRDILKLVQDSQTRLVQNGNHLLDIVVESLQRLEKVLCYEETPAWRDVWDLMPFMICPKCECEIKRSNYKKDMECPQCKNRIKKPRANLSSD